MRAVQYRAYRAPLELVELPDPVPGDGQLLLRVLATSVNPVDWKMASGRQRLVIPATLPHVPGYDVAGEVVGMGAGVTRFALGDRVHARLRKHEGAACAELTVCGADLAVKIAAGADIAEAAGLPLAGMTALQGLRDRAGMALSGCTDRILVVGASGGVGHLAVQIAKAAGATVVGVCSARNAAFVADLGASDVVAYDAPDPFAGQEPFDVVLDCVGGSPTRWLKLLKPGGRFASTMPGPAVFLHATLNGLTSKTVRPVMLSTNGPDLQILADLVQYGKLRVVIDSRYPLDALAAAWERSKTGRAVGKIVIDVAT